MRHEQAKPPDKAPTGTRSRKPLLLILVLVIAMSSIGGVSYTLFLAPRSPIANVAVTADNTSVDQGQMIVASATLVDRENIDQTRNATFDWSANPSPAVKILTHRQTSFRVQVKVLEPGNVTLKATGTWDRYSKAGQVRVSVRPVQFEVRASKLAPVLGEQIVLGITAVRSGVKSPDRIAVGYNGTVNFTADDSSAAVLPHDPSIFVNSGGRSFPGVVIRKAGPVRITIRDTVAPIGGNLTLTGDTRPVPIFTAKGDPLNPLQVVFNAAASYDPDDGFGDAIVDYEWNFGDHSTGAMGQTVSHAYAQPRVYMVSLKVTDSHQTSNSSTKAVPARSPLVARFSTIPMVTSLSGFLARVDASESQDPNGTIQGYNWTWGDGTTSPAAGRLAFHNYTTEGTTVTIALEAWDNNGLRGAFHRTVKVTTEARPPQAEFAITLDDPTNLTVDVDGSASTDDNGDIVGYNWSWGDGNFTVAPWYQTTATHVYGQDGYYNISLTAMDSTAASNIAVLPVRVIRPTVPPVAVFVVKRDLLHVEVDGSSSHDLNNNIANYTWSWGDESMSQPANSPLASHDYARPGRYDITLVVMDSTNLTGKTRRTVSVGPSTVDYTFYDFFNFPYREYWDIRQNLYYDTPINANCFNKTSIDDGICRVTNPNIPAYETYPYTNWYPLLGANTWSSSSNIPFVYAPYRWRAVGRNVPGYTLGDPVFLPVMNYSQAPGSRLDFRWSMDYITPAEGDYLANVAQCPGASGTDGYYIRSQINVTMDLQESKRIFGVDANVTDQHAANWWWFDKNTTLYKRKFYNVEPPCYAEGIVEMNLENWFVAMGGGIYTMGKYDIENGFEYPYTPFYTQMNVTVDPNGTTHVNIDHMAWGTEVLLARMMFWGNTSYRDNANNWTRARGWWGMETAWFENLTFRGSLNSDGFDFYWDTAEEYHFQLGCDAGPDGQFDHVDDRVYWTWGPSLNDYLIAYGPQHTASEMIPYANQNYPHCTPGGQNYGSSLPYDYVPASWDLSLGQTWHFQFPTGNVVFYDPNRMTSAANPKGDWVASYRPLTLYYTNPENYGAWDPRAGTWDVYGPSATGGPKGSQGSYPTNPWGAIYLKPRG